MSHLTLFLDVGEYRNIGDRNEYHLISGKSFDTHTVNSLNALYVCGTVVDTRNLA